MKYTKKAIRQLIENALQQVSLTLDLSEVPRKTRKAILQVAKDLSGQLRDDLKKQHKRAAKVSTPSKKVQRKSA